VHGGRAPPEPRGLPFFLSRFYETVHYYLGLFDSLDAAVPRQHSAEKRVLEREVLGRAIVNSIASEGHWAREGGGGEGVCKRGADAAEGAHARRGVCPLPRLPEPDQRREAAPADVSGVITEVALEYKTVLYNTAYSSTLCSTVSQNQTNVAQQLLQT